MSASVAPAPLAPFRHEALFYDEDDTYLAQVVAFVEAGLDAGEDVLVAVPRDRLDLLAPHLDGRTGATGDRVRTATMEQVGRNPAWIIPVWAEFVASSLAAGRAVRGVGEPIWPGRSADELDECVRHEALLNSAFASASGFTLLCPYDAAHLDPSVLVEAEHTHPYLDRLGACEASTGYRSGAPDWSDTPLSPVPAGADEMDFGIDSWGPVRRRVAALAGSAGLSAAKADDAVLAVDEAITNTITHAGGGGELLVWADGRGLVCEVRDRGHIADPMAGRVKPTALQPDGRGLWLIHQVCDLVQIRRTATGQVIRMRITD